MVNSTLNLMVAGTEDGILMIEGAADFLPEETLIEALRAGHEAIKTICRALRCVRTLQAITDRSISIPIGLDLAHLPIQTKTSTHSEWSARVGKPKRTGDLMMAPPELKPLLKEKYGTRIDAALKSGGKNAYSASLHGIEDDIMATYVHACLNLVGWRNRM